MFPLCIKRASGAFLTASRLLCISSSEIRISSLVDVILIPLELIQSNRDAVRKAREALNTQREHIPFSSPLPASRK